MTMSAKDYGLNFGFPECCVDAFENNRDELVREGFFDGTGFIPCKKCGELDPKELFDEINEQRDESFAQYPFPFDENFAGVTEEQMKVWFGDFEDVVATKEVLEKFPIYTDESFAHVIDNECVFKAKTWNGFEIMYVDTVVTIGGKLIQENFEAIIRKL